MADGSLAIITGPTAAGKSALALALAERTGATIISADSRQLYRGFDIGTAKPSAAERARVSHRGLDAADPRERWSAARWAVAAAGWIDEARAAGRPVIVVGGTGFYVQALVAPLASTPPLDAARRAALDAVIDTWPTPELRRHAAALDPTRAHLGRAQLKRAIETALLNGTRLSDAFVTSAAVGRWSARYLVVDPGAVLAARIERRVDAMLAAGWVDEVRTLMASTDEDALAWNACGYAALRAHVAGALPLATARDRVVVATRQYAKRQRTWIRHQLPPTTVTRLDPATPDADARVMDWFRDGEGA